MAHIGVERLRTGHRQHDRSQRQEGELRIGEEEAHRPARIDAAQYLRMGEDAVDAEHRQHGEIEDHDRPEQRADLGRAIGLDREQPDQDQDRDRHHQMIEPGLRHREPLDRRQDRNGGRDDRVAVEERGRGHAEHDDPALPPRRAQPARYQRQQREAAALPLIVRAQDQQDIFDRDDEHHRPEDQAEHAVDVQVIDRERMVPDKAFLQRIERRSADIAEHDADRAERERGGAVRSVAIVGRRGNMSQIDGLDGSGHVPGNPERWPPYSGARALNRAA